MPIIPPSPCKGRLPRGKVRASILHPLLPSGTAPSASPSSSPMGQQPVPATCQHLQGSIPGGAESLQCPHHPACYSITGAGHASQQKGIFPWQNSMQTLPPSSSTVQALKPGPQGDLVISFHPGGGISSLTVLEIQFKSILRHLNDFKKCCGFSLLHLSCHLAPCLLLLRANPSFQSLSWKCLPRV